LAHEDRLTLDAVAAEHLALWPEMPPEWRHRWQRRTAQGLQAVPITGASGFAVTDTMRTVICAHLGMAALGLGDDALTDLHGITLYPQAFWVDEVEEDELTGVVSESRSALSGQAIGHERIVLSWEDVLDSRPQAQGDDYCYNVVIHEFTHHLQASRPHGDPEALQQLEMEYQQFAAHIAQQADSILDPYGAESAEEFLAIAAEAFFHKPRLLQQRHHRLFDLLVRSFRLNPLTWS
jgi:hypothetical protein